MVLEQSSRNNSTLRDTFLGPADEPMRPGHELPYGLGRIPDGAPQNYRDPASNPHIWTSSLGGLGGQQLQPGVLQYFATGLESGGCTHPPQLPLYELNPAMQLPAPSPVLPLLPPLPFSFGIDSFRSQGGQGNQGGILPPAVQSVSRNSGLMELRSSQSCDAPIAASAMQTDWPASERLLPVRARSAGAQQQTPIQTRLPERASVRPIAAGPTPRTRIRSASHHSSRSKPKTQSKIDTNEELVSELESKVESLRQSNVALTSRNTLLEKFLNMGKEPHQPDEWWMDDCTRSTVEKELGIGDTLTFTVYEEHPLSLSRSQILNLSYDQYDRLWKMFVDALSSKLILCKGRHVEGSKDSHRLLELVHQAGSLRCAKALSHPSRIASYHYSMGQAQDSAGEKSLLNVWRKLVGSLELLPAQKIQIAELRGIFLAKTATTQQRRSAAAQQLAEALPQGDFYHQGGFRYVKAAEALELLQQTLRDQHIYDFQMQVALCKHCLNPVQGAKVVVESYPNYPDVLAIMNAIHDLDIPLSSTSVSSDA